MTSTWAHLCENRHSRSLSCSVKNDLQHYITASRLKNTRSNNQNNGSNTSNRWSKLSNNTTLSSSGLRTSTIWHSRGKPSPQIKTIGARCTSANGTTCGHRNGRMTRSRFRGILSSQAGSRPRLAAKCTRLIPSYFMISSKAILNVRMPRSRALRI